ncbi:hypothetical protein AB4144_67040, partial [Rhizobiaceae sp. 2RAB30]
VNPLVWTLWRVDVVRGRGNIAERGTPDTKTWSVDATGEARVRIDEDALNHKTTLYGRAKGEKIFKLLARLDGDTGYMGYS